MDPTSIAIAKSFKYGVAEAPLHQSSSSSPHSNGGVDDTELSIFDAHKYFSENSDLMKKHDVMSVSRLSSVSSTDGYGRNFRTRSFNATPTASSEASWNSQTGLLTNPPGFGFVVVSPVKFKDSQKRSSVARKRIFGRKCCCSCEKSVEVKEVTTSDYSDHGGPVMIGATKSKKNVKSNIPSQRSSITNSFQSLDPPRQQRISTSGRPFIDGVGGFSFPILNDFNLVTKPPFNEIITKSIVNPLEDPPRDSLEVFQPMHEAAPGHHPLADDDARSDASSDLFEIESFSTQTSYYPMYRRRDSLDEAPPTLNVRRFTSVNDRNGGNIQYGRRSFDEPPRPSVAATECYSPSEFSIDWSVTTTEGFDRASVSNFSLSASEIGSAAFLRQRPHEEAVGGKTKKGNGGWLLLMSCRQEKAVSVGPQPVKCVAAAAKGGGRPPRVNKLPLGSDYSARLTPAFVA